jgi:cell shape-determining protein MreD
MNVADIGTAQFADIKIFIEAYTGLERDALHVHLALLIYMLAMFLFRQSRRSRFPWIAVLLFELANEFFDLNRQRLDGTPLDWHESAKDLWNTMLWPTVLLLVGRYTTLFEHRSHRPEEKKAD